MKHCEELWPGGWQMLQSPTTRPGSPIHPIRRYGYMIPRVVIYRLYFFLKSIGPSVERATSMERRSVRRIELRLDLAST